LEDSPEAAVVSVDGNMLEEVDIEGEVGGFSVTKRAFLEINVTFRLPSDVSCSE